MVSLNSEGTKRLDLEGKYCYYCGKQMIKKEEWQDYQHSEWYICDCDNSKHETQLKNQLCNLHTELSYLERKQCSNEEIYKAELIDLNKKYGKS